MKDLVLKIRYEDQDGKPITDRALCKTAMTVYNKATELLINPILIPMLNDVLYGERKFPLEDSEQQVYEDHGFRMMEVAYEFTAYSGFGKCGNYLVYPTELLIHGDEDLDEVHDAVMRCVVKPL